MSAAGQKRKADRKSKQKLKKEKRRLEKLERSRACAVVQAANVMPGTENTPLNFLTAAGFHADSPFCNYTKNDLSVHLDFASAASLSPEELNTMYELTKTNMLEQYNRAAETDPTDWTWNEKKKRAEMGHEDARYLVARASPSGLVGETKAEAMGEMVGFAHVRFEMEGVVEVCYVYELQLAESAQKHGLGKRMMQLIELSSVKLKMKWVMLTVFKANVAAGNFYQKLKYEVDETDPSLCEEFATDEPSPYNILSKCVDRELKKRLDAMKFLNNAVAEDIRQEQAAAVVARKGGSSTPKKRMELPKKTSP